MLIVIVRLLSFIVIIAGFWSFRSVSLAYEPNSFAPHEMIVKYKKGQSPGEIAHRVAQRQKEGNTFIIGQVVLFLKDLTGKMHGLEIPEDRLIRINQTDASIGVVAKELLVLSDQNYEPIYVFKLDGSRSIDACVELYRNLPEVEYAEPNFLDTTAGI